MAYQSPASKGKKKSALKGLFEDPVSAVQRRETDHKTRAAQQAAIRRMMRKKKGKISEKEIEMLDRIAPLPNPRKK